MTAKYWTKDGEVMCRLSVRTVFDFTNLDTNEVVTLDNMHDIIDAKFLPVVMPNFKRTKVKKKTLKAVKSSRRGPRAKSKYKGVSPSKTPGKFRVQFFDKKNKKNIGLGTFDSELLAAAAYQERAGNHKEARRLQNEYEEGDPPMGKARMPSEQ